MLVSEVTINNSTLAINRLAIDPTVKPTSAAKVSTSAVEPMAWRNSSDLRGNNQLSQTPLVLLACSLMT